MRLARERAVPETKLTPTFLELLVELGGVELCWPDPYLRSPAPWVTWDFPMHLHCATVEQCNAGSDGRGELDRGFFNWTHELLHSSS